MIKNNDTLLQEMITYYSGDPARIQHFLKVYEFAALIGRAESLDKKTQAILETAAIVHDIGIKPAEAKFKSSAGHLQEQEGPAVAREMLTCLGYDEACIARVCYLVGHHHTYTEIDGLDYQILVEADFLVNLYEDHADREAITTAYERIFRTETGKQICRNMFQL